MQRCYGVLYVTLLNNDLQFRDLTTAILPSIICQKNCKNGFKRVFAFNVHSKAVVIWSGVNEKRLTCLRLCIIVTAPLGNIVFQRGSNINDHVLFNLLNESITRDKMRCLSSILSPFRNEFHKFNNTVARMMDSIYHRTLRIAYLA